MKVHSLSPEITSNPYLEELKKYRKAKDWIFHAMQILQIGFRDLAVMCKYYGDKEFYVFMGRVFLGRGKHRLRIKSFLIKDVREVIEKKLKEKYELDNQNIPENR